MTRYPDVLWGDRVFARTPALLPHSLVDEVTHHSLVKVVKGQGLVSLDPQWESTKDGNRKSRTTEFGP